MQEYKFHVLGCRGSRPMSGASFLQFGGATSCYLMRAGTHAVVLDCGTGLYDARPYLKGCSDIDVLVTHIHYDHVLGLLDKGAMPTDAQIRFFVSGEKPAQLYQLSDFLRKPFWPIPQDIGEVICVDCDCTLQLSKHFSARFFPANHPDNSAIIRLDTDCGSMCLVSDWEHPADDKSDVLAEAVKDCSFILYDGMYVDEEYPMHKGWGHSTWQEGIKVAVQNKVPQLIITHHLPERTDSELLAIEAKAKKVMPTIHFARAGDDYLLSDCNRVSALHVNHDWDIFKKEK